MIDLITFLPDCLYLNQESMAPKSTIERFFRSYGVQGKSADGRTATLSFSVDGYSPVKIKARQLKCARWWVYSIMAVLPSLIWGHNGRPIRTAAELWQALTILAYIVSRVTNVLDPGRIIPGVGSDNRGFILRVENTVQFQDPLKSFLLGSHFTRMKNQQRPSGVYYGESTCLRSRERRVSIYDKKAKVYYGVVAPSDIDCTRVEAIYTDAERLAKDAKATKLFSGQPGEVVATLAPETSYALIRQSLTRLAGFGWLPDAADLESLGKSARGLACGLGGDVARPHRLNGALETFRRVEHPKGGPTFRRVERELRAYAVRTVLPDPMAFFPKDPADLMWSDVLWRDREEAWAVLMRDFGAPTAPDPAIAAAWGQTRFLAKRPEPAELIGTVAPSRPPFLTSL
ncbi:MAG: hypothetical protein V4819_19910 [Verrucomicrobiota bacterium]